MQRRARREAASAVFLCERFNVSRFSKHFSYPNQKCRPTGGLRPHDARMHPATGQVVDSARDGVAFVPPAGDSSAGRIAEGGQGMGQPTFGTSPFLHHGECQQVGSKSPFVGREGETCRRGRRNVRDQLDLRVVQVTALSFKVPSRRKIDHAATLKTETDQGGSRTQGQMRQKNLLRAQQRR
jgi:hypothetical protein